MALSVTVQGFHTRLGTQANGRFAIADITSTDGSDVVVYTVPPVDVEYAILTVSICNREQYAQSGVSVAVASTDVPQLSEFIEWNATISPNGVLERTQIICAANERIIVRVTNPTQSLEARRAAARFLTSAKRFTQNFQPPCLLTVYLELLDSFN